jgi:hypothetical protein
MAYTITLTAEDERTIDLVGRRYAWSSWAGAWLSEGENTLAEHEAWEFAEAIDADTDGGHSPFPMLDPESDLYAELQAFRNSIV